MDKKISTDSYNFTFLFKDDILDQIKGYKKDIIRYKKEYDNEIKFNNKGLTYDWGSDSKLDKE